MAPFTQWLPQPQVCDSDLLVQLAGGSRKGLEKARKTFERGLAHLGLEVCVQPRGEGFMDFPTVRLRISNVPIPSMGHGCDVLAFLGPRFPEGNPFGLQDRSVLVSECVGEEGGTGSNLPQGVIQYHVPFSELNRSCGSLRGKGLIAVGVLTKLLDIPKDVIRSWVRPISGFRYFDAGYQFASEHLHKKDIYGLPHPDTLSSSVLLSVDQALLLGLGIENCLVDEACVAGLVQESADDWVMSHVRKAWQVVTSVRHPDDPFSATRFQGPWNHVTGVMGIPDPPLLATRPSTAQGIILLPADALDVFHLTSLAPFLGEEKTRSCQVVIDNGLTNCSQTVSLERIAGCIRERLAATRNPSLRQSLPRRELRATRQGESPADVGFVAWGSVQSVVREALGLCRKFGMNVAALYPKVLWPLPAAELEAFAATVKQLVVVEPNRAGHFAELIRTHTSLEPTQIFPEIGQAINPMDIFLKEGFPGYSA